MDTQLKDDEIDGACSKHGKDENAQRILVENPKCAY
jgi:hypothetical protein